MSEQVRCINRDRNKVAYFSKHLVDNPLWRKHTGFEPQLLCDELKTSLQAEVQETLPVKKKMGRPKKIV